MISRRGTQPWRVSNFRKNRTAAPVPPRLHQDVEDVAVLIHGAPQILLPTVDRHEELVEMPGVAERPAPVAESSGVGAPERQAPLSNGLVGDRDPALGEKVFHVPENSG